MFTISDKISSSFGGQSRNNWYPSCTMSSVTVFLVGLSVCLSMRVFPASGSTFTPNSLASKLLELGVPDWDVPTIVCLAHNASHLDTGFIGHRADVGYNYYGIFGIPDKLFEHKTCKHMTTALALDNQIEDDVKCLMNMIKDDGYFSGDRTTSIQVFTQHDVNLAKCFDWFAKLPPYGFKDTVNNTAKNVIDGSNDEPKSEVDPRVSCTGPGAMTNIMLFTMNLALIGLCWIAYMLLAQLKVNYAVIKFNENSLL